MCSCMHMRRSPAIMATHQAAAQAVSQPERVPSQSQCLFVFTSSFAF